MKLKVIGDPQALKTALGTNRHIERGQLLFCADEALMQRFASLHPTLVRAVDIIPRLEELTDPRREKDILVEAELKALSKPKGNKMLSKTGLFKSK